MKTALLFACSILSFSLQAQNLLDNYLSNPFTITQIASSTNPRDLEFKPYTDELWVVNKGTSNGGNNLIVYRAGRTSQTSELRKDSHTSHFMLYPSALAFSDIGEFATAGEAQNSSGSSSTFMGPVIWSSDTFIFARVFQSNWATGRPLGSHLDMLHQSPMAMGIAHDSAEVYWVFDGWNSTLCKYDFVTHHGPGYEDHTNGIIWRYTDVDLSREVNVPSHMIKDKSTGWLYIANTGYKTLMRVKANTGAVVDTLTPPGSGQEYLDGYYEVNGMEQEMLDTFTTRPCGIDLFNGRLIVGDYDNGNITMYDITGASPVFLGVIATGHAGMEGITIGTDGRIWFVNNTQNAVFRIDPVAAMNDAGILEINSPAVINGEKEFFSTGFNLCSATIAPEVTLLNAGQNVLTSATLSYTIDNGPVTTYAWTGSLASTQTVTVTLPVSSLASGKHKIFVTVSEPNGVADQNLANDTKAGAFRSVSPVYPMPFMEDFSVAAFPPANWDYIGYNINAVISRNNTVGGFGTSPGCVFMDNFSSAEDMTGQLDYLMLPLIDMQNASALSTFEFNVAYARYSSGSNDALRLLASTDCGNTWFTVYDKSGSILSTAPSTSSFFVPSASQWRHEIVDISALSGNAEVLFMFETESDYGNNVYIDDIGVLDAAVSVNESDRNTMRVYPNPATGLLSLSLVADPSASNEIRLLDSQGRLVYENNLRADAGSITFTIDISGFSKGAYTLTLKNENSFIAKKVFIQ